jgi:hypothetical protein
MDPTKQPLYSTVDQIEKLVRAFEACTLPPARFNHQAHMTVALWYLAHFSAAEATERMRAGLHRFLDHHGHGLSKYNETITLFWMKLLRHFLDAKGADRPLLDVTNEALASLGSMHFVFSHYSRQLVFSEAARVAWVEPDLLPIPF